jgi:hypothetical protein
MTTAVQPRAEVTDENRAPKGLLPLCLSEAAERFS